MQKKPTLYLVDASSYFFRAFFAIRELSNSEGLPTNAVFGFTGMLSRILRDLEPDYLAMVFDTAAPTFREEIYEDYKANREEMPDELSQQLPYIRELVDAYRIPKLEAEGYEADDVIGTIVERLGGEAVEVVIVTGDKDFMQLVRPGVTLLDTMKDRRSGEAEVREKFGVDPDKVTEVMGLAGDSSDNIPGVPGIGLKTASELVRQFGGIEKLVSNVDRVKGEKRRESIRKFADQAKLSRELATIRRDVPLKFDLEQLAVKEPDKKRLRALFRKLEFRRFLEEIEDPDPGAGEPGKPAEGYEAVLKKSQLSRIVRDIRKAGRLSVDLETTSLEPMRAEIVGIALAARPGAAYYVPMAHRYVGAPKQIPPHSALEALRSLLEDANLPKIGQNIKYDWLVLKQNGIDLRGIAGDSMVASYLLNASPGSHGLDAIAKDVLGHRTIRYKEVVGTGKKAVTFDQVPVEPATAYAAEDADIALRAHDALRPRLSEEGLDALYDGVEIPLIEVLGTMEQNGVRIDEGLLRSMSREFGERLREIERRIYGYAGEEFNINSSKQLQRILFDKMKFPSMRKTKTGFSTDESVLERLSRNPHLTGREILICLLEYRKLSKLRSTYLDALPAQIHPKTGRVHTSYNQVATTTGRLSSTNPNLQNIPIRSEEGRQIRRAFITERGHRMISADYSQIELRILAHVTGDPSLCKAFCEGEDVHRRTAAEVFGVKPADVTSEMRSRAKAINFGLIYGQGPFGLSQQLGVSSEEAKSYIRSYFKKYKGVKAYLDACVEKARKEGFVTTLLNRRRYLPEISSKNGAVRAAAERAAKNMIFQGTAADLIKTAMCRIHTRLRRIPGACMVLQVHDELVFEAPENKKRLVREMAREEMEGAMELEVPLVVDIHEGSNWGEAH